MWILSFLADDALNIIINVILWLGIVLTFLSFFVINRILRLFPVIANYHLIIQIVSVIILLGGVYLKGSYSTEMIWREKVKIVENQLKAAEIAAGKINVIIEEKVVYKDRIIKEKGETQIKYIDRVIKQKEEIIKYIEQCPIPKDIIIEHNLATQVDSFVEKR
jgi:hypothetical protein